MKVLSLFDGIGTGRLSLERAGINVDKYYASEIDKNAITIAKTNYSDIIELGSVLNWRNWDIEWNTIDLLIGGSPCTSFSSAGKQQGFNGESKLFFEYRDILNYLKSINPNIKFLLENVIMKKEWEEVITNEVGVKPILIDSSLLSAQQRKRNYWFNWKIEYPEDKHIELKDILDNKDFCYKATIVGRRINNNGHREDYNKEIPIVQCLEVRKANSNKSNCLTTVELDEKIADVYKHLYPNDNVIVGDALKYLESNYNNFDFIWASPPCQSHGQYRHNVGVLGKGFAPILPDMSLYSIIIFLKTYYKGNWCVENVIPYYKPLIEPTAILQRHLFWSNKPIANKKFEKDAIRTKNKISDFDNYEVVVNSKISNKRQVLRNCVKPEIGLYILSEILK